MRRTPDLFLWRFLKNRRGATTIEFALTAMAFIFLVLFIAEMARLAYISSVIDLAVSEAAKQAKNAPVKNGNGDYRSRFENRLTRQGGKLWGFLTQKDMVTTRIMFASSIAEMTATGGNASNYRNQPIARYQLGYRYHPMFFPFPGLWANNLLNREVIFVQEYERSKFMD